MRDVVPYNGRSCPTSRSSEAYIVSSKGKDEERTYLRYHGHAYRTHSVTDE